MRKALGVLASIALGPVLVAPGPAAPAYAATCGGGTGVSVVVDFRELGGGLQTTCVPAGGGRSAAAITEAAGYPITWVQRQPGFVCRLSGVPAEDPCVNTPPSNAYWGLYWSDGSNGKWAYSTLGATSLTVPDGGSVGFAWQGAQTGAPAVAPPVAASTPPPSPTKSPSKSPIQTSSPSPKPSATPTQTATATPTGTPTPTPSPSPGRSSEVETTATATPTASPTKTPREAKPAKSRTPRRTGSPSETSTPTAAPTPSETASDTPTEATSAEPSSGQVPTWVVVALVALLVLAAAAAAVRRRVRGGS